MNGAPLLMLMETPARDRGGSSSSKRHGNGSRADRRERSSSKPWLRARIGEGDEAREITVPGRFAWTLGELVKAGEKGCTPIEQPAPRWSHYIFRLRRDWLVNIETIDESHAGPYAGSHARYVLRSPVTILENTVPDAGVSR